MFADQSAEVTASIGKFSPANRIPANPGSLYWIEGWFQGADLSKSSSTELDSHSIPLDYATRTGDLYLNGTGAGTGYEFASTPETDSLRAITITSTSV